MTPMSSMPLPAARRSRKSSPSFCSLGVRALHAADVLDQELQRDVDEAAIEAAATKADRQRHRGDLADGARRERGGRAHDALR